MKDIEKAVALAYGGEIQTPKIIASGRKKMAILLVQKAKELNVPIFQNQELVESLINLDINEEINEDSYLAVAKILIWLNNNETNAQLSKDNF
ncbi:EscU/YscU/HrcU family type III secretion system export apparatus switch protein [Helicobacter sp. MIT 14-3879]|uniref:EscU/YscU/HrcU family type III secretion system export apparatus switch protein n=1 Tax=Helicobacter sp. MIT 14-3879 TaxID=2040649 RepID=UPI000E1E4D16|nr:EscU/YscU/HrcU family type III secretion system export apparatus switch protein [Helicobacter sp. MIT 14-3879]RDU64715.1 flagellar biosynthesis protein FlhB [Helicobacter sp. MIT 14-3879]